MKIERLRAEHYDELLEMLNSTFAHKYGHPVDFESMWPKMWVRDDEHMSRHIAVIEDGKIVAVTGVYPFETYIGESRFTFATTGNVATRPEYEGRGYFKATFGEAVRSLPEMGVDAARLGGSRQRYERFGYALTGIEYKFTLSAYNAKSCASEKTQKIEFKIIEKLDTPPIQFANSVYNASPMRIVRSEADGMRDVYAALTAQSCVPYIATLDGEPIGYLCAVGAEIYEVRAVSPVLMLDMLAAYEMRVGGDIHFPLPAYMAEEVSLLASVCDGVTVGAPSYFNILNFEGIADALLAVKAKSTPLPSGSMRLGIEGYGTLELTVDGDNTAVRLTDRAPEVTLSRLDAARYLFSNTPSLVCAHPSAFAAAILPLPLGWNKLDCI